MGWTNGGAVKGIAGLFIWRPLALRAVQHDLVSQSYKHNNNKIKILVIIIMQVFGSNYEYYKPAYAGHLNSRIYQSALLVLHDRGVVGPVSLRR
jgi:hypothetical protein